MKLERYEFSANDKMDNIEFYSEGPRGRVKKYIRFGIKNAKGVTYFNLSFGDAGENARALDDLVRTNNSDKEKVLATVAAAVLWFTEKYPDMYVYAQGSTPARTRLYQMGICNYWKEIEPVLTVYGYVNGIWQPFEKNINYEAFCAIRK